MKRLWICEFCSLPCALLFDARGQLLGSSCHTANVRTVRLTGAVAKTAGRDYIGIELNQAYVELAKRRINVDQERLL